MNHLKSQKTNVPNRLTIEIAIVLFLVALGVASRFWLIDYPNFKPVAAIAMLMGALFKHRSLAFAAPLAIMLVSDFGFGFCELPVLLAVYGSMVIAVSIGLLLGRWFKRTENTLLRSGGIGIGSILMSLQFFLITNAAVCASGWYPMTLDGLMQSYIAGLPFLKFTMVSNILFSFALFSTYFSIQSLNITSSKSWDRHLSPQAPTNV